MWSDTPTEGSGNAITSRGVYNAIGGTSAIQYEQNYSSSAVGHSAGYAFTPEGAYYMYSNIMSTVASTYATQSSVTSQINSAMGGITRGLVTRVLPSQTTAFTIATTDWTNGQATVTGTFNVVTGYMNDVLPTIGERAVWDYYGVYPTAITATSITFECATTPAQALTFNVVRTSVSNPA